MGWDKMSHYFSHISYGLLMYALHGIPEILAYFVAGLAGGIIFYCSNPTRLWHEKSLNTYSWILQTCCC
jgi:hypothetical protein